MATACFKAIGDCLVLQNPYEPMCGCANLQIEKSGLLSVPADSTVCLLFPSWFCKFFTGAVDLFLTPWLLALHFLVTCSLRSLPQCSISSSASLRLELLLIWLSGRVLPA